MKNILNVFLPLLFFSLVFSGLSLRPDAQNIDPGIRTIVIDPGHGGKDPGCSGKHNKEKDIVLKIAKKFGSQINANYPDVKVIYTRTTDKFIPLDQRADIANKNKADLFVSIHLNWFGSAVSGAETYVMGLNRAKENLEVAKRENASILLEENYLEKYQGYDPNSNEGHIWLSMVQNAYLDQSINFATLLDEQFINTAKRRSRGVKQAGFVVLRMTTMPSVLIEAGFLSNRTEEQFLESDAGQNKIALAMFNAFRNYKIQVEDRIAESGPSTSPVTPIPVSTTNTTYKKPDSLTPPATKPKSEPVQTVVYPKGNTTVVFDKPKPSKPSDIDSGEVIFMVQVSASKVELKTSSGSWTKIDALEMRFEDERYKYLVGGYNNLDNAISGQHHWRAQGFKGAFVVAYHNGTRITLQEAKALLKGR